MFEIIEIPQERKLTRPIDFINGISWSSCLVTYRDDKGIPRKARCMFNGTFTERYSDKTITGHLPMEKAPVRFEIRSIPDGMDTMLSQGAYVRHVIDGQELRPLSEVFTDVRQGIDHFVKFTAAYGTQEHMASLLACWSLSTYAQQLFSTAGYIWTTGEAGSGKSQCLKTLSELVYMGLMVVGNSSSASTRDMADLGATLCFDDIENFRDPSLKELLLSGNSKGARSMKQTAGKKEGDWKTEMYDIYGARVFSAINLPDAVLGSRAIMIPFTKSDDASKNRLDPKNPSDWIRPANQLRDEMWLHVVRNLGAIDRYRQMVPEKLDATGREFDIWWPSLTVAMWLEQEHNCYGLFAQVQEVYSNYQRFKAENATPSEVVVLLEALAGLFDKSGDRARKFQTMEIQTFFRDAARNRDISDPAYIEISLTRLGQLMSRSGFKPSKSHGSGRSWMVSEQQVQELMKLHGVTLEVPEAEQTDNAEYIVDPMFAEESGSSDDDIPW